MIEEKDGEVTFRGIKSHVMAEAVTVLRALKETVSEEEYKMVIRLADKSEKQLSGETGRMREVIKKVTWIIGGIEMSVKKRDYYMGGKKHTVELKYDGYMYTVISDGVLFKQTPNKLFAVQVFNEI